MFTAIAIVGMHFRGQWAKDYVSALQPGDILRLEREPENQYDAFAIKALTPHGLHLGYVESSRASFIAVEMDEDPHQPWVAEVETLEERKRNLHPIVTVRHATEDDLFPEDDFDDSSAD